MTWLRRAFVGLGLALIAYVLFCCPRSEDVAEASSVAWQRFQSSTGASEPPLSVMSFNVRHDAQERDPRHHWTQRMGRIAKILDDYAPWSVGMQEPWSGQVLHLQSILPPGKWKTVGYRQDSPAPFDLGHPSRHWDHQVGIIYDSTKLRLSHHAYHWLSSTPEQEGSKSWGSVGARTINVAHFQLVHHPTIELLHFNSHLDVWSEQARREQARMVRQYVQHYRSLYPRAVSVLTGDFNAAVGQESYRILTDPSSGMLDAWTSCRTLANSTSNLAASSFSCLLGPNVASSFHGWMGLRTNGYAARLLIGSLFTLHGMGLKLPYSVPRTLRALASAVLNFLQQGWSHPISEALPASLSRMHVDWVLFQQSAADEQAQQQQVASSVYSFQPMFVSLVDLRDDSLYSSDHYPLLAAFWLNQTEAVDKNQQ